MKRAILCCSVALLLATGTLACAGAAQAMTSEGVTVPDVDFTAGTGNHTVDITIAAGSPVVGSADQLAVSVDESVVVGVTTAGVGGSCSSSWICEPGSSGWRAGTIQLTVSTAKASPCTGSGALYNCFRFPLVLQIVGDGMPTEVSGSVLIISAAPPTKAPTTAPPTTKASQSSSVKVAKQATTTKQAVHGTPIVSTVPSASSQSASPVVSASPASVATSASAGGTAVEVSRLPVVVDAADAKPASSSRWVYGGVGVAVVLVLLSTAFAVRRRVSRAPE